MLNEKLFDVLGNLREVVIMELLKGKNIEAMFETTPFTLGSLEEPPEPPESYFWAGIRLDTTELENKYGALSKEDVIALERFCNNNNIIHESLRKHFTVCLCAIDNPVFRVKKSTVECVLYYDKSRGSLCIDAFADPEEWPTEEYSAEPEEHDDTSYKDYFDDNEDNPIEDDIPKEKGNCNSYSAVKEDDQTATHVINTDNNNSIEFYEEDYDDCNFEHYDDHDLLEN